MPGAPTPLNLLLINIAMRLGVNFIFDVFKTLQWPRFGKCAIATGDNHYLGHACSKHRPGRRIFSLYSVESE